MMAPRLVKVLVVDDEPDVDHLMRQMLRRRLKRGEVALISAHDGVEALSLLRDHDDVKIAFCDLNMPRMDGFTLLDRIRAEHPEIHTVIVSAYDDHANRAGARTRGAAAFLTKPLDSRRFEATLDAIIATVDDENGTSPG